MYSKFHIIIVMFFLTLFTMCQGQEKIEDKSDFPVLKGKYLGQKPPGLTPEIFAPGIVSKSDYHEHSSPFFTKNGKEVYWSAQCIYEGESNQRIFFMKLEDGKWTKPEIIHFTRKFHGGGPVFSLNEKRLFFYSCRPRPFKERFDDLHIWYVDKTDTGWSEPVKMSQPINSENSESNPAFTSKGIMYFDSKRSGGEGGSDIYFSKYEKGQFTEPENLGVAVNTEDTEYAPCIAPDESYLIFSRYTENPKGVQLYISFSQPDGSWTKAEKMSEKNKLFGRARFPGLSPDGKYLFFCAYANRDVEIYWMDEKIIEELTPEELK
jgi:hypothetical protein